MANAYQNMTDAELDAAIAALEDPVSYTHLTLPTT